MPQILAICASHAPGVAADVAEAEGTSFRAGLAKARRLIEDFRPELVVTFGSDHRRAWVPVIPTVSVVTSAKGLGDHLLDEGIDVAVSRQIEIDHGFGASLADLVGGVDVVPTLPIFINCATAPLPRVARIAAIGDAVRRFLDGAVGGDYRVLVLGSGGLSHNPPTLDGTPVDLTEAERKAIAAAGREAAALRIRPEWDQKLLQHLAVPDGKWLESLSQDHIDRAGVGANEVRAWVAAWAAAGRPPMQTLAYEAVPAWITGMAVVAGGAA
jgi:2,3-dihydroxyphenylpropionate 1,2-dioxygenase